MTHQSLILLATLLVLAGLAAGYFLGWLWDLARPHLVIVVYGCRVLFGMWRIERKSLALMAMCWDLNWREEPFLDTEPAA